MIIQTVQHWILPANRSITVKNLVSGLPITVIYENERDANKIILKKKEIKYFFSKWSARFLVKAVYYKRS